MSPGSPAWGEINLGGAEIGVTPGQQVGSPIPNHPGEAQEISQADDTGGRVADGIGDRDLKVAGTSISSACTTPAARSADGIS